MSKLKTQAKRLLQAIEFEAAPLSNYKGRHIPTCSHMTKKDRRHSGRFVIYSDDEDYPILFEYWNDWADYRDSMRDKSNIRKNLYPRIWWRNEEGYWNLRKLNLKLRKHEKIRRMMRQKERLRQASKKVRT